MASAGFVSAAAALTYVAQSANAFVSDGDSLRPPIGSSERRNVLRDFAVRLLERANIIEDSYPLGPFSARAFLEWRVAHACELGVVRFRFLDELKAGYSEDDIREFQLPRIGGVTSTGP